ncbi:MAG: nucleoside phosphorylase [Anaerolineae bacterium]|nr:nucleoside phosphorylase [Anaerolineae bacterium]
MTKSLYLRCEAGDIHERILLTGDPARVDRIAGMLSGAHQVAQNREFYVISGDWHGTPVSVVSSGIGAPSAAIALEELAQLGARAVVRVGTMMGVDLPMGSFVLSTGAARFEGTSPAYLGLEYPAIPDWDLVQYLLEIARARDLDIRLGLTASFDAFYPQMAPTLAGRKPLDVELFKRANVLALDMETSLLYVIGTTLHLATASMCLITNNAEPFTIIDQAAREMGEDALITTVLYGLANWSAS